MRVPTAPAFAIGSRWHTRCYAVAVPKKSDNRASSLLAKAHALQKRGKLKEAGEICRQILLACPKESQPLPHSDALHLLGILAHQIGQPDEAAKLIADSLTISPRNAPALVNLAAIMKEQERYEKAILFYQAALDIAPRNVTALNDLGSVFSQLDRIEEAVACFNRVLRLEPNSASAWNYLGLVFQGKGEYEKALECFHKGLAAGSRSHLSLTHMGVVLANLGRLEEAVQCCESAIKLEPNAELPHAILAGVLKNMKKFPESIESSWRALKINPRSYLALCSLGSAYTETGEIERSIFCLRKASELKPDDSLGHIHLGVALSRKESYEESIEQCKRAIELEPNERNHRMNLAAVYYIAGKLDECMASFREELDLNPESATMFSRVAFSMNYLPHKPEELFAELLRFDRQCCEPLRKFIKPLHNSPDPRRRLRVGYVSADFNGHAVAHFIEPILINYSRRDFEVFCYSNRWQKDDYTERFSRYVDGWRDVEPLTDDELADAIRADGIDILVDLSGHTAGNRLPVFARKPAPIQVIMIGYMQTTGMSAMDYRITDAIIDPPGVADRLSTEKLIRLPAGAGPFLFPQQNPPVYVNELPALKNGYITFASFHNLVKINAEVAAAWAKVLHAVPDSKLMIVARNAKLAAAALQAHGIGPERIELFGRVPMREYLLLHHRADLVLDTFPFNGYTTNLISAWMGLPFITLVGHNTVSRVGEGLLRRMELPELLAADQEGFVRKAVEVAADLPRLAQWRAALRPRLEAWMGDGSVFTAQLEEAFHEMWRRWCAQQSQAAIPADGRLASAAA